MFCYRTVCPYHFIVYRILILHLNVRDSNDNVLANVMLVTNKRNARMLRFTKHCKDMLQERLMILMSLCSKFIRVYISANNYLTVKRFGKVIAEIK